MKWFVNKGYRPLDGLKANNNANGQGCPDWLEFP